MNQHAYADSLRSLRDIEAETGWWGNANALRTLADDLTASVPVGVADQQKADVIALARAFAAILDCREALRRDPEIDPYGNVRQPVRTALRAACDRLRSAIESCSLPCGPGGGPGG